MNFVSRDSIIQILLDLNEDFRNNHLIMMFSHKIRRTDGIIKLTDSIQVHHIQPM